MTKVRMVISFGELLRLGNCEQLAKDLGKLEFEMPKKRKTFISAAQAVAIRAKAHERGYHSLALAQAIQFELMIRQKDVIGEWVPLTEPGLSEITYAGDKWLHGIRWSDIDGDLILRKLITKSIRGKQAVAMGTGTVEEFDLKAYPMIMEELARYPAAGRASPVIVNEHTGRPWVTATFQQRWREIATAAGIPRDVQSRDSRAGGITEATDGGATIEQLRGMRGIPRQP